STSILSGHANTLELLTGLDRQRIELMRMSREAYVRLCMHFRQRLWLQDNRHVSVEEKMTIFLTIIRHNERLGEFQHSSQTVRKYFHEVLNAIMKFTRSMIVPTTFDTNLDILGTKYYDEFLGAVGVPDGTLVHAVIPTIQQTVYRTRGKGKCYQNVLGICDFNIVFTVVWAGWEGVAHDSRVLTEVMTEPNKYYLCDVAYRNTRGFMAPYHNGRYWLGDFRHRRAITKEQKFNHAHAKARNVIKRAYGTLKARFPILDKMAPYPCSVQRDVVIVCVAVNNIMRK
ncbi:LOW QUALITY PROTEIN: DDE_4 domain-containing protein, partial [Cephalotus follicularis]